MPQNAQRSAWLTMLPVNLNHFRLLRVVGKGAFGKVRIVERKDTGLTFALKYIRKDESTFAYTLGAGLASSHGPGSTRDLC
jgi:serine/threonine protein kinase